MKRLYAALSVMVLAACASAIPVEIPRSTDSVKDATTAIRIGQDAYAGDWAHKETNWHAELHHGF